MVIITHDLQLVDFCDKIFKFEKSNFYFNQLNGLFSNKFEKSKQRS